MGLFEELAGGRFRWPGIDSTVNKIVLSHEELTLLRGGHPSEANESPGMVSKENRR